MDIDDSEVTGPHMPRVAAGRGLLLLHALWRARGHWCSGDIAGVSQQTRPRTLFHKTPCQILDDSAMCMHGFMRSGHLSKWQITDTCCVENRIMLIT